MSFYFQNLADVLAIGTSIRKDEINRILQNENPVEQLLNCDIPVFNFIKEGEITNRGSIKRDNLNLMEKDVVLNINTFSSLIRNYKKENLNEPLYLSFSGKVFMYYKKMIMARLIGIAESIKPVGKNKQVDILFKEICDDITSKPAFVSRIYNEAISHESDYTLENSVNIAIMSMITAFHLKNSKGSGKKETDTTMFNTGASGFIHGLSSSPVTKANAHNKPVLQAAKENNFCEEIIESIVYFKVFGKNKKFQWRRPEIVEIITATMAFMNIRKQTEEYAITVLNEFGNQGKLDKEIARVISLIYHRSNAEIVDFIIGLKNICRAKFPLAKEPIIKCDRDNPEALGCQNTRCRYASPFKNLQVTSEIDINLPEHNLNFLIPAGEYHTCSMTNLIEQKKKEILSMKIYSSK